jgi:hypothetical protein
LGRVSNAQVGLDATDDPLKVFLFDGGGHGRDDDVELQASEVTQRRSPFRRIDHIVAASHRVRSTTAW